MTTLTTSATAPATPGLPLRDRTNRPVPRRGGFNATILAIELRRTLRNRRTLIFTIGIPAAILAVIVGTDTTWADPVGAGNEAAYIVVSLAVYAAATIASIGGAMVGAERALGWSRQLRLTPLRPLAYILSKALVSLAMAGLAIAVVNVAGLVQGRASMPVSTWIACGLATLVAAAVFAAFGLCVGYLFPGENAMQLVGPGLAVLAFLGGVFYPLTPGSGLWHVAVFTPMYGVAEIARAPLTGDLAWYAVLNAVVWFAVFVAGAAWRMGRDTSRV